MLSFRRACYYTIYCDSPRHSPNQAKKLEPPFIHSPHHLSIYQSRVQGACKPPAPPATLLFTGLCIYSVRSYTDSPTLFSQLMNSIMNQISLMLVNHRINHSQCLVLKIWSIFSQGWGMVKGSTLPTSIPPFHRHVVFTSALYFLHNCVEY